MCLVVLVDSNHCFHPWRLITLCHTNLQFAIDNVVVLFERLILVVVSEIDVAIIVAVATSHAVVAAAPVLIPTPLEDGASIIPWLLI